MVQNPIELVNLDKMIEEEVPLLQDYFSEIHHVEYMLHYLRDTYEEKDMIECIDKIEHLLNVLESLKESSTNFVRQRCDIYDFLLDQCQSWGLCKDIKHLSGDIHNF